MINLSFLLFGALLCVCRSRRSLVLEDLALRQQLSVLKRRHPRSTLGCIDKRFWIIARQSWPAWYVPPDVRTGLSRIGLTMVQKAMLDGRKAPCSCTSEKNRAIFCPDRILARDNHKEYGWMRGNHLHFEWNRFYN